MKFHERFLLNMKFKELHFRNYIRDILLWESTLFCNTILIPVHGYLSLLVGNKSKHVVSH